MSGHLRVQIEGLEDEEDDVMSQSSESSKNSVDKMWMNHSKERSSKVYEIDFIGNGTYQVTQLNILQRRSIEPARDQAARLSARGLHHRRPDVFAKDVRNSSAIIHGALLSGTTISNRKNLNKASTSNAPVYLFSNYFQRALGLERLNKVDEAIADYTTCIDIDPKSAQSYFNRAGLYRSKGNNEAALADLDRAVQLDPANAVFRSNRALIHRERGTYLEAISETMMAKALHMDPSLAKELRAGNHVNLDTELLLSSTTEEDPILDVLRRPKYERTPEGVDPVVDFLKTVKFFASFSNDRDFLRKAAARLDLRSYEKDGVVFNEGQPGHHFYIILYGEVSIVKVKMYQYKNISENVVLRKLYRGNTFGEAALEGDGLRTAGVIANQRTHLLAMHVNDYKDVMSRHRLGIKHEIRETLSMIPAFVSWEMDVLDRLSGLTKVVQFVPNEQILTEGDPPKNLFVIRRGMVKLIKSIRTPQYPSLSKVDLSNPEAASRFEPPGSWVLDNNTWRERFEDMNLPLPSRLRPGSSSSSFSSSSSSAAATGVGAGAGATAGSGSGTGTGGAGTGTGGAADTDPSQRSEFTVGLLGSGQVFNELAVLDPEKMSPVTAIAITAVEAYSIPSSELIALGARFNPACMKTLAESLCLHNPPADKIHYFLQSKFAWEARKAKMVENISKQNRRRRLPLIRQPHTPKKSENDLGLFSKSGKNHAKS